MVSSKTPVSVLVVSCSLRSTSRSHLLAKATKDVLLSRGEDVELVDLRELNLPLCDGASSYNHPSIASLSQKIANASAILLASPIYNYDVNAAAKNLIELTGSVWNDKLVGFLCAAGGEKSYMSPIGLANSLMLDFRSLIIPRFIYVTKEDFESNGTLKKPIQDRVEKLVEATLTLAKALSCV